MAASLAPVAQLDRASDYESEGRAFESLRARQFFNGLVVAMRSIPLRDRFLQSPYNHRVDFRALPGSNSG